MTNTTTADTVTLRVPATAARLWDATQSDLAASRDALSRDTALAWNTGHTTTRGAWEFTTTRTIAGGFLATLAAAAESEFDADNADTQGARNALRYVDRMEASGLRAVAAEGYRMTDPADQARLEADRAADRAHADQRTTQAADNATHRAAWMTLTREERATRTQDLLDAAFTVLGLQRTDQATAHMIGGTMISVVDGRLYMEVRRLRDRDTAQPAVDASREALQAAGWTVTDWGTHFYAQAPQAPAEAPQGAPVAIEWTKTVRGHRNGTATLNGTTYRITHITHADRKRGHQGDHLAHAPSTDDRMGPYVARTWGLDGLLALLADREGITGPLAVTQTGRPGR
jgi:hypothetical protein